MSPKMHLPHCTNICTAHQFIAVKWCLRLQACASGHAAWLAAYSISADTQPQPASGPAEAAAGHPAADEVPSDSCAGVVSHRASSAVSTSRNAQPHRLERRLWTATPALWIPQGIPSEQHAGPVCPRRLRPPALCGLRTKETGRPFHNVDRGDHATWQENVMWRGVRLTVPAH